MERNLSEMWMNWTGSCRRHLNKRSLCICIKFPFITLVDRLEEGKRVEIWMKKIKIFRECDFWHLNWVQFAFIVSESSHRCHKKWLTSLEKPQKTILSPRKGFLRHFSVEFLNIDFKEIKGKRTDWMRWDKSLDKNWIYISHIGDIVYD